MNTEMETERDNQKFSGKDYYADDEMNNNNDCDYNLKRNYSNSSNCNSNDNDSDTHLHDSFNNQYENLSKKIATINQKNDNLATDSDSENAATPSHLASDKEKLLTSHTDSFSPSENKLTSTTNSPRRRISPQNRHSKSQDQQETRSSEEQGNNHYNSTSTHKQPQSTILLNAKNIMDSIKFSQRSAKPQYQSLATDEYYCNTYEKSSSVLGMSKRLVYAVSLIVATIIAAMLCIIYIRSHANQEVNYLGTTSTPSELGTFSSYAISTDASPCAPVGARLIQKGGSAVDSAIGTLICMGLVIPNSMGIGGGSLMTIYDRSSQKAIVIDGREEAPDYATEDMFGTDGDAASRGPLSVGIPGELMAYHEAHSRYGKLNWSELFEDTIKMAEEGVPLVEHMHYAMHVSSHSSFMRPSLRKLFTNNQTGELFVQGDIIKRPDLAKTLVRLRDHGVNEFYGGETGRLFVEDLKKHGGKITLDNLKRYRARVGEALTVKLANDLVMHTQPLPGSGHILSLILRVMGKLGYYGNRSVKDSMEESGLYYHHLIEAFKFGYAQRGGLEDYKKGQNKRMEELEAKLNSDAFVEQIVSKITNTTHDPDYYGGTDYFANDHGTAHVSVVDNDGSSIAATTSVNLYFGAGLLSESTGLIYNDIMDDFVSPNFPNKFNLKPSKYNRIAPGKRPLSSMVPSIFISQHGDVRLSIGASGGSKITTAVAMVSLRHLFLGDDIKTCIDAPRIHHQLLPNSIVFENEFPKPLLDSLRARKHNTSQLEGRSSVVMAVASNVSLEWDDTRLVGSALNKHDNVVEIMTANSDYRKGGSVAGF